MQMEVSFPGGKRVDAAYKGFTVATDQPASEGGDGSAPEPFDLFLASLGTCAGVYVVYFCESRDISTEGIRLTLDFERDEKNHRLQRVTMTLKLPSGFPDKYRQAVVRAAEMCTVKRTLADPPQIVVNAE